MTLADDYRILGLRLGADFEQVKVAYRQLARRYHPDVNPGSQLAKEKFIQVTQAYRTIAELAAPEERSPASLAIDVSGERAEMPFSSEPVRVRVNPRLSAEEQQLKQRCYETLQSLFRDRRFPRAVALVEGLAQRMPEDPEVRQWQAITYQRWGRSLIAAGEVEKARRYLEKSLRTDPLNKSLVREIQRDFQRLGDEQDTSPPSS